MYVVYILDARVRNKDKTSEDKKIKYKRERPEREIARVRRGKRALRRIAHRNCRGRDGEEGRRRGGDSKREGKAREGNGAEGGGGGWLAEEGERQRRWRRG